MSDRKIHHQAALTTKARVWMTHGRQSVICRLRKFETPSRDIFFEVLDRRSSRDRQDHLGSLEQPCQCNLQRGGMQLIRHLLNSFMCVFCLTERSPRKKGNIVLLAVINDKVRLTVSKTVTVLDRDNRDNLPCAFDVLASHI